MKSRVTWFALGVLASALGGYVVANVSPVQAQVASPIVSIPKAYGAFKGGDMSAGYFEAVDGTLRQVGFMQDGTVKVLFTIRRQ